MKIIKTISIAVLLISSVSDKSFCPKKSDADFKILKSISVPGDEKWDYSSIDESSQRLFISHSDKVQVIDLKTDALIGEIDSTNGVHGIAIANDLNRGYISCGKSSTVVVFDLTSLKVIKSIKITGTGPDGILYDDFTHRVFAFCGKTSNVIVIDAKKNAEINAIALPGRPEFGVSDGKGKIYNNIEDKNEIAVINATTLKVEAAWPLAPCEGPTGLAIDKVNGRLFTACRGNKGLSVIDVSTGKVISTLPIGSGVDAVAYDADKNRIFASNGDGTLTIIQQGDDDPDVYRVIQNLATQKGSKTMALNNKTHKVYLCAADFSEDNKVKPGTFKVLVAGVQGN